MSMNLYSYCFNNPIAFVDPSGHKTIISENLLRPTPVKFTPSYHGAEAPKNSWVILNYIIRKNGGSLSSKIGSSGDEKLSAKMYGHTHEFASDSYVYNAAYDLYFVKTSVLQKNFASHAKAHYRNTNWTLAVMNQTLFMHQAGDLFDTMDHAAIAFSTRYFEPTKDKTLKNAQHKFKDGRSKGQEYSAYIFDMGNGFTFDGISWSSKYAKPGMDFDNYRSGARNNSKVANPESVVAFIHTHPSTLQGVHSKFKTGKGGYDADETIIPGWKNKYFNNMNDSYLLGRNGELTKVGVYYHNEKSYGFVRAKGKNGKEIPLINISNIK